MPLDVLIVGGTGEISSACAAAAVQAGHRVTLFNRGQQIAQSNASAQRGVRTLVGDIADTNSYAALAKHQFDVVCQFLGFTTADVVRDIELFQGRCGQYLFVSSASAYQKPSQVSPTTEQTPLDNPFMEYSRNKAACEQELLQANANGKLAVTVVRPSHTYNRRVPSTVVDGDHLVHRMLARKPVLVHGTGESLWTLTHADDFARAFVGLFANSAAVGEAYHITHSQAHSWNFILTSIADLLECQPQIVPVPVDKLIAHNASLRGPLLGDKANSMVFDNRKIAAATKGWRCEISLHQGLVRVLALAKQRMASGYEPNASADRLIGQIADQA